MTGAPKGNFTLGLKQDRSRQVGDAPFLFSTGGHAGKTPQQRDFKVF